MKKSFILCALTVYGTVAYAAEKPMLKISVYTASLRSDVKSTDEAEYVCIKSHSMEQIPLEPKMTSKDIHGQLNKAQQSSFGTRYDEGRLYLKTKDISSDITLTVKDSTDLAFISYLFKSKMHDDRSTCPKNLPKWIVSDHRIDHKGVSHFVLSSTEKD